MDWVIARLKEPSTWAGLSSLIAGMTFLPHAGDIATLMPTFGSLIAGVLAIVLKDKAA